MDAYVLQRAEVDRLSGLYVWQASRAENARKCPPMLEFRVAAGTLSFRIVLQTHLRRHSRHTQNARLAFRQEK